MRWEKIAVIAIVCYLAIALPLYLFNQNAVKECEPVCSKDGYNMVTSATALGENIECKCYDSFTRKKTTIIIQNG